MSDAEASICFGYVLGDIAESYNNWVKPLYDTIADLAWYESDIEDLYLEYVGAKIDEGMDYKVERDFKRRMIQKCPFVLLQYEYWDSDKYILAIRESVKTASSYIPLGLNMENMIKDEEKWTLELSEICKKLGLEPPKTEVPKYFLSANEQ